MSERGGRAARILCAGNLVLDEVFRMEKLPLRDGKADAFEYITVGGGCAANAAVAIARLGARARHAGPLGDDEVADRIVAELTRAGVECVGGVRVPGARSQVSAILVNAEGERTIATFRDARLAEAVAPDAARLIDGVDGVLVDNRMPNFVRPIAEAAHAAGLPLVLDADRPTRPDDPLLGIASHVIFSAESLRATFGTADQRAALKLAHARSGRFVAVTNGPGEVIWVEAGALGAVPAFAIDAIDTLAAGDVFHGAFLVAMIDGCDLQSAIRFASAAAAIKCTRFGGGVTAPNRAEVEQFLRQRC